MHCDYANLHLSLVLCFTLSLTSIMFHYFLLSLFWVMLCNGFSIQNILKFGEFIVIALLVTLNLFQFILWWTCSLEKWNNKQKQIKNNTLQLTSSFINTSTSKNIDQGWYTERVIDLFYIKQIPNDNDVLDQIYYSLSFLLILSKWWKFQFLFYFIFFLFCLICSHSLVVV